MYLRINLVNSGKGIGKKLSFPTTEAKIVSVEGDEDTVDVTMSEFAARTLLKEFEDTFPTAKPESLANVIAQEAERAMTEHGPYHSPHEGWAVIREEYLEAISELEDMRENMGMLDECVREDSPLQDHAGIAEGIQKAAEAGIWELIQVAATAKRYIHACAHKSGEFRNLPE